MKNQLSFNKYRQKFKTSYGGALRQKRKGRLQRPLSKKAPLHLVFKARRGLLKEKSFRGPRSFLICQRLIKRYSVRFFVKVDQCSIQADHIHLLVRCSERFFYQAFFRVLAGQIAQKFRKEGLLSLKLCKVVTGTPTRLWMHRPFTRVVVGFKGLRIIKNYIQLNEQEAQGKIRYNSKRLAGLSAGEWALLWT